MRCNLWQTCPVHGVGRCDLPERGRLPSGIRYLSSSPGANHWPMTAGSKRDGASNCERHPHEIHGLLVQSLKRSYGAGDEGCDTIVAA
jgi:hypothetical protein